MRPVVLVAVSLLACVGCPSPRTASLDRSEGVPADASANPGAAPVSDAGDPDRAACDRLCAREQACSGVSSAPCRATCLADVARMKPGFVGAYVACFSAVLDASCGDAGLPDDARVRAHDRCFDQAVARFPRDDENQRDMAEAVCDRGLRCQGLDKLGRDACMKATLDPQEPEVKLGQRLVDALRRERVRAFRACVDASPCPGVDLHDDAVDRCYAKTIADALAGGPAAVDSCGAAAGDGGPT